MENYPRNSAGECSMLSGVCGICKPSYLALNSCVLSLECLLTWKTLRAQPVTLLNAPDTIYGVFLVSPSKKPEALSKIIIRRRILLRHKGNYEIEKSKNYKKQFSTGVLKLHVLFFGNLLFCYILIILDWV